uniref:Oligosaccharyltransferase complex subunit n=1 Tax=Panagrellus redivivus TaxID=6233 RepID=A0A7E4WAU2_PANRE
MDAILNNTIFTVIDPPHLRIQAPKWFHLPSPMQVFAVILGTYFIVTGGIVYDIINEPPSIGSTVDERGNQRPVAILPYRINGQYIMEGLVASFMFLLGGLGFIILDRCNNPLTSKNNRIMMLSLGFACVIIPFLTTRMFMRIKLPDYLG